MAGDEVSQAEPELLRRPNDPNDFAFWDEKLYLKIQNHRDPEGAFMEDSP